jgi:TolB-like protein
MSGDKAQQYFSDGLTEELLNSLARITDLQVAARTSSFSSLGEHPDISTVAHKLNVGAVMEGSVRKSGRTIRITAQLVNGVTGFHIWSATYDRSLGDELRLQTEIATAVATALKVNILGDLSTKIELGGTRDPAAFDAYLRGRKLARSAQEIKAMKAAVADYTEAITRDTNFALAYSARSIQLSYNAEADAGSQRPEYVNRALLDALKALALAPDLAEAHLALAWGARKQASPPPGTQ